MANKRHYTVKQIETALREAHGFLSVAAERLGCTYHTVRNYINRYKSLQNLMEEINERELDFSENKLLSQIKEGNTTAIIFHLKCKGKSRGYIERQELEHTGKDGGPIQLNQFAGWTKEDLANFVLNGHKPASD